jgi:hypothetical protein
MVAVAFVLNMVDFGKKRCVWNELVFLARDSSIKFSPATICPLHEILFQAFKQWRKIKGGTCTNVKLSNSFATTHKYCQTADGQQLQYKFACMTLSDWLSEEEKGTHVLTSKWTSPPIIIGGEHLTSMVKNTEKYRSGHV